MEYGKLIGIGNTADVYEYEEGRVLKLFHEGYPREAVEKEYHNAAAIKNIDFPKPNAIKIVICENRSGIVYDKVKGESLLDWVAKTKDVKKCAAYMANLHKSIIRNKVRDVQGCKEFLRYQIKKAPSVSLTKREEALQIIDRLQDGDTLCHGDFHPGNIFLSDGYAVVIDFMNVCQGHYLYDIARSVFLVEYTPLPEDMNNREVILGFRKTLADLYLSEMNVSREMIQDYLTVIIAARDGECPDEQGYR